MKNEYNLLLIGFFIIGVVFAACTKQTGKIEEKGFLEGKIDIGPLCPVARDPPDPGCEPTEETYKNWPMAVFSPGKKIVAKITPDKDGNFNLELPVGNYVVDLENKESSRIGGNNLPAAVEIEAGQTANL